jgi:hypothetical protein
MSGMGVAVGEGRGVMVVVGEGRGVIVAVGVAARDEQPVVMSRIIAARQTSFMGWMIERRVSMRKIISFGRCRNLERAF